MSLCRLVVIPLLVAALPASAAPAAGDPVAVPETLRLRNVPVITQDLADRLRAYENLRAASFQGWHPEERRLLITTRFADVSQIHEVAQPLGARTQLTFLPERTFGARYRPGRPRQILFSVDEGGAENFQLLLLDRDSGQVSRLSDGTHRYESARWSRDGRLLAYVSNARNGVDFDLYVQDPDRAGSERRVADLAGTWSIADWSRDGARILLQENISANESHLHEVDLETGALTRLTPTDEELVAWQGPLYAPDDRSLLVACDQGSEFLRLLRLDRDGTRAVLSGDRPWNVDGFDLSEDGRLLAFITNEDGLSRLRFLELESGRELPVPELPPGVIGGGEFRPGSHELGFALNWARSPSDVYSYDPSTGKLVRWTESELGGLPADRFAVPELVRFPTFDDQEPGRSRTIPAWVFRPDPRRFPGPRPVYIEIHGGPEGQTRPVFLGSSNYLVNELGVALVQPNVRGSSGYGKSYLLLDNGMKREDSVRDIGALLDWIRTRPELDAGRVMVGGGSYGGYMTLAAMTLYGERLRAGFDYVGISNFVTFLENTSDYRRDRRRVEYGDERDPAMRKYLEGIAPAHRVDRLTRPMLVAQGANDPRVPLSESDQIVAALSERGVPVWYVVAMDEGHGFRKKKNADYLRLVWIEFIERHLLGGGPARSAQP
jgi:dipeptidyl aminopeptidase/acylaminoacyl peptidase